MSPAGIHPFGERSVKREGSRHHVSGGARGDEGVGGAHGATWARQWNDTNAQFDTECHSKVKKKKKKDCSAVTRSRRADQAPVPTRARSRKVPS